MSTETIDPKIIFRTALQWDLSSKILGRCATHKLEQLQSRGETETGHIVTDEVASVTASLCLELYFKCLLAIESGTIPHSHKLLELFRQISPLRQKRIRQVHKKIAHPELVQFKAQILKGLDELPNNVRVRMKEEINFPMSLV